MAPFLEVADVFRRHGEAFRQAREGHLGYVERRVMGAITACRTAALGGHVERAMIAAPHASPTTPAATGIAPSARGCGTRRMARAREAELLPVPYFHVVFTLPTLAAEIAFQNKAVDLSISVPRCRRDADDHRRRSQASRRANRRHRGAPYWGSALTHHPHIQWSCQAAASRSTARWVACRPASSCRCACSRVCFVGCSWRSCPAHHAGGCFFGDHARLADPRRIRCLSGATAPRSNAE